MNLEKLHFASDYMEGCHPAVLDALVKTNFESTPGYGSDKYCDSAKSKILEACGCPDGEVHLLVGGTQTNAVVIDSLLRPYQGVIAADSGHVAVHEAGAIEYGGHKVLTIKGIDGKINATQVSQLIADYYGDDNHTHMVMPGMVYISQPTEYGSIYSLEELTALSDVCKQNNIPLYLDGARLAYALATPENDVTLKDIARLCDIFYIGGTKCGLLFGEAVVIPKKGLIPHLFTMIKQHGALLSKGRLLGVQFDALFTDDLYLNLGKPAIESAIRIKNKLRSLGVKMPIYSPTNQVFFVIDNDTLAAIGEKVEYSFMEKYDESSSLVRFATSWFSDAEKTDKLLEVIDEMF